MSFIKNLVLLGVIGTLQTACGDNSYSKVSEAIVEQTDQAFGKGIDSQCFSFRPSDSALTAQTLNGYRLNSNELENLHWIKRCVLPYLPGTTASRIKNSAQVTWWSLREGVLELSGERLFRYANCHFSRAGDHNVSDHPLWNCETNIWQVGIMAGQVMNYSLDSIQNKISQLQEVLGSELTEAALLEWTANLAGYDPGSEISQNIVASTGRVRRSWLMRNPLIALLLVKTEVIDECLNGTKRWCFAGQYPEARKFSGSRSRMLRTIRELEVFFRK